MFGRKKKQDKAQAAAPDPAPAVETPQPPADPAPPELEPEPAAAAQAPAPQPMPAADPAPPAEPEQAAAPAADQPPIPDTIPEPLAAPATASAIAAAGDEKPAPSEEVRKAFLARFGQVTLAMAAMQRYKTLPIGDLQKLILEPLARDRVAVATAKNSDGEGAQPDRGVAGVAIWATVSDTVDAKIREQIKSGVFPVSLDAADWNSGQTIWLFDLIAPSQKLATGVFANFRQVARGGKINLHPIVTKIVDMQALNQMGEVTVEEAQAPVVN